MSQPQELTIAFSHQILYTNKTAVPAEEIADALLALARIVERAPKVLKTLVPGVATARAELFVERLESGSIKEDVFIHLIFGSKEEMQKTIQRVREKLGIDLNTRSGVVRAIVIALILSGALTAGSFMLGKVVSGPPKPEKATVEMSNNLILSIGEGSNLTGEQILKAVDIAVSNKTALAKDAVQVIRPAKRDPKAEIKFDGSDKLKLSREQIAAVPSDVPKPTTDTGDVKENVQILIRAADMDRGSGWAAVVPSVSSKRMRLELAPNIDAVDLFAKKEIKGTVEVLSSRDAEGKMQLRAYYLVSIAKE